MYFDQITGHKPYLVRYHTIFYEQHPWPGDTLENNVDNEMERNIRVLSLNLDKVFEYTPLQDWWREDLRYTLSVWKSVHLSEVARYEL